jgi:hypothetical protein
MAKARPTKSSASSNKRMWQAGLAIAVIGIIIAAFMLRRDSGDSGQASTQSTPDVAVTSTLRDRLVLPAKPERPRPITLEPATFTDPEVKQAYQAAKDNPEALEGMACYCGCFGTSNHRSNLDCFKDNHGAT